MQVVLLAVNTLGLDTELRSRTSKGDGRRP